MMRKVESRNGCELRVASCETRVAEISRDAMHRRARPSVRRRLSSKLETRNSKPSSPPSSLQPKASGLTLIELLVVIVILMTLVGGVIPVLSPNNEARKIREASRGLRTYIMQAQARAARTGRSVGIAFRETSSGSGVALEVFQIEIPPPFTGFSSSSTAVFRLPPGKVEYVVQLGEGYGKLFDVTGQFVIPPRMTRPGDLIRIGNGLFQLGVSHPREVERDDNGVRWFVPTSSYKSVTLVSGSAPPTFPVDYEFQGNDTTPPNSYRIVRQPVTTSESPYTLPAGVAIDMHASGTEGGATPTLFAARNKSSTIKQIGIMFSPSGSVDSVHYSNGKIYDSNGIGSTVETPITDASRLFFLLGRVENVLDEKAMLANGNKSTAWINESASDEELTELQEQINWLNLDSRWIVFDTRSGRSVVTENNFVDARRPTNIDRYAQMDAKVKLPLSQLDAARKFARQMRSGGR